MTSEINFSKIDITPTISFMILLHGVSRSLNLKYRGSQMEIPTTHDVTNVAQVSKRIPSNIRF
jgi:hypothetical protein